MANVIQIISFIQTPTLFFKDTFFSVIYFVIEIKHISCTEKENTIVIFFLGAIIVRASYAKCAL